MDDRLDRLENMLTALGNQMAAGFAAVGQRFDAVHERFTKVDERFTSVDERVTAIDAWFGNLDRRLDEMRAHLTMQIDSVRDDVRIFAEAHVALEQRTTRLERRPR
jgi:hypothetical protein